MCISTSGPVFNSKSTTFQGVCLLGSNCILKYLVLFELKHFQFFCKNTSSMCDQNAMNTCTMRDL